jgi:Flp pilus assembly protein TadD
VNALAFRHNKDPKNARKFFEKAIEANPLLVDAHLGLVWLETEDIDGGADTGTEYAKNLLHQFPKDYRVYNAYGTRLFNSGLWEEGLEQLELAINLSPDNSLLWNNKAYGLLGLGQEDAADAAYVRSAELAWNRSALHLIFAGRYFLQRDPPILENTIRYAERAIALDDQCADAWVLLSDAKCNQRNHQEAISLITQALDRIDDRNGEIRLLNKRAFIYLEQLDLARAEIDLRQLEQIAGSDILKYGYTKARVLHSKGQRSQALAVVDQMVRELRDNKHSEESIRELDQFRNGITMR